MRKIKIITILGILILILTGCLSESDRAERVLQKHLKARYGEEFVIFGMGKRAGNVRRWYEAAVIYPKSYIGTRKENDSYYWGKGFVDLNNGMKGGDTYGGVLLNESANKFYGKKLKELFGENYLAVLDVGGYYESIDFEEEMKKRKKSYDESPNGVFPPISGGIYIFGRVENDEDREWYRKQIYEFIQFMKKTETFEYVDLGIIVWDERTLSKEFRENKELRNEIITARNKYKDDKEFIKTRKKLMEQTNESIKELTNKEKKNILDNYIRSQMYGENNNVDRILAYNELLGIKIYSPKYINSHGLHHREKLSYERIEDVKYWNELY
ncbi:hypothetical protein [Fusobacterium varium]|uniref:hypothetical protein n=1 Tax=Fusobacterium varium TaxID=856 RepID=UPI002430CD5F|nr:hypothetical protein [Fusobacterium varium]